MCRSVSIKSVRKNHPAGHHSHAPVKVACVVHPTT